MQTALYSTAPSAETTDEERATMGSGSDEVEAHTMRVNGQVLRRALFLTAFGCVVTGCFMALANGHRSQARAAMAREAVARAGLDQGVSGPSRLYGAVEWGDDGISEIPAAQQVAERVASMPAVSKVLDKFLTSETKGCEENEEHFFGLCYKKCATLTGGEYPMRSAPEVCCKTKPCLLPSEVQSRGFFPCNGFDISGTGSCPHAPGHCDEGEEYHLGMCFKKCELLSAGAYPIRVAANTCCKAKPCWNIFNLKTEGFGCSGFGVGGGGKEGHECPHKPL